MLDSYTEHPVLEADDGVASVASQGSSGTSQSLGYKFTDAVGSKECDVTGMVHLAAAAMVAAMAQVCLCVCCMCVVCVDVDVDVCVCSGEDSGVCILWQKFQASNALAPTLMESLFV